MTNVFLRDIADKSLSKYLPSKTIFDKVEPIEATKPEIGVSGFVKQEDSVPESSHNGDLVTPIIANTPNFYKERGVFVSKSGFIRIPRSLYEDSKWMELPPLYRCVLHEILMMCTYKTKDFNVHGKEVWLAAGQFCCTQRELINKMGGPKFFPKTTVVRALGKIQELGWIKLETVDGPEKKTQKPENFGVTNVDQTVDQKKTRKTRTQKTIITVLIPGIYEQIEQEEPEQEKSNNGPNGGPKADQKRTINEERKKERSIKETFEGAGAPDRSSLFYNEKEEEEKKPSIYDAPPPRKKTELSEEQQKNYSATWEFLMKCNMTEGNTVQNKDGKKPLGIKPSDLQRWIKDYDFDSVRTTILQVKKSGADKSFPGLIQHLFKINFAKKQGNTNKNRSNLEELINAMQLKHLKLHKQYVEDQSNDERYNYNLPEHTFNELIEKSISRVNYQSESQEDEQY